MWVAFALAMGIRGAPIDARVRVSATRVMLAAAVAVVALLATPAFAGAATYPVNYDFSQGILAQAANPDSPPPGANDWSCRPSDAHPRPIVLVHGLLGEPDRQLADDLSSAREPRLLRLLAHLRDQAERLVPRLPARRPDHDGGERAAALGIRRPRARRYGRGPRRHRRALRGQPDARLLRQVPRRRPGGAQLRRHHHALARNQPRRPREHRSDRAGLRHLERAGAGRLRTLRVASRVPGRLALHYEAARRRRRCPGRDLHEHRHPQRRAGRAAT